jgi:hypothetical protein
MQILNTQTEKSDSNAVFIFLPNFSQTLWARFQVMVANTSTVKAPLTDSSYERTALSNGQFFGHRFNSYKFVKKVISIERTLC